MPIIQLENIWKAYGAHPVLNGITWKIEPGERIGLIGQNGCGKTTLFHILTGNLLPDQGRVHRSKTLDIGYLSQDPQFQSNITVLQAALEGFQALLDLQKKLGDLEDRMGDGSTSPALLEEYGRLRDRYEQQGGYAVEARAKAILSGLGFRETDHPLPVDVLSSGQRNRLALAQLLAREPDLLLLDEPTNHLDLQAIEWLEHFLSEYAKAFVIISHDRYFLDRAIRTIVELEGGKGHTYTGNYTFYFKEKQLQQAQQRKAYQAQQAHIARTEDYIQRNIAGQKTKQAQSRRRALEKLERLDRPVTHRDFRLKFASVPRSGDRVLEAEGLCKAYDQRTLFQDLNLLLWRGDRLGIIGPNGSGKSTLLKLLIQQVQPDAGHFSLGTGVKIGYYDQTRQDLHPNRTVLEEIWSLTPHAPVEEIRTFLGAFLFSGDDVKRNVGKLSGGEQSRLALAKLVRSPLNFLILDEPTNHLDIPSRNVLEQALETFTGTLIAVSHDRYFLNRLVNRLLIFEDASWRLIDGNYATLLQQQETASPFETALDSEKATRKETYTQKRKQDRQRAAKQRRAEQIEQTIAELEAEAERLTQEMAREDLATDWNRLEALSREKAHIQEQVNELFSEWESIEVEIARTA
ncbi:MAG: ABC-F family ATP-binding cassette domain-containing protein [bacterium]|nr:ABC-F family ATP-binding cassette domain-containing protein [bacterium]